MDYFDPEGTISHLYQTNAIAENICSDYSPNNTSFSSLAQPVSDMIVSVKRQLGRNIFSTK